MIHASTARADGASGTWSGSVEARGNYYWETSTRVIAPELSVELESPAGVRIHGNYLVDTITSASLAAGVRTDVRFTEIRHDVGGGLGYELDLGDMQLDLSASARLSHEPDYDSRSLSVGSALALNDRSTVLQLNLSYVNDEIGKVLRGANRVGMGGRDLSDRGIIGTLNGVVVSAGITQTLSPVMTLDVGYDIGVLSGFLANPYRQVSVDGVLMDELHPDSRTRHTAHARLAYFFRPTSTAFHVLYRAYIDSWDIAALTPEGRIYQELGDTVLLRARYRYYTQTRAFFQADTYSNEDELWTSDPKMTKFHSHLLGAQLALRLTFLEESALDFAWQSTVTFGLEYMWNTNSYGNAVIGQAALRIPF